MLMIELLRGGHRQVGRGNVRELSVLCVQFFCKPKTALINKLYELKKKRNLGEGCLKETNLLPSVVLPLGKK